MSKDSHEFPTGNESECTKIATILIVISIIDVLILLIPELFSSPYEMPSFGYIVVFYVNFLLIGILLFIAVILMLIALVRAERRFYIPWILLGIFFRMFTFIIR